MTLLDVRGVSKRFRGLRAVHHASFAVGEGNIHGLIGPNGAGKTTIFNISRSIEIILGPVIGGVGTLFGPVLGAAVLTLLSDGITEAVAALGFDIPGIKQVFYGVVLLAVVMFLPHGIWPALARKLRL